MQRRPRLSRRPRASTGGPGRPGPETRRRAGDMMLSLESLRPNRWPRNRNHFRVRSLATQSRVTRTSAAAPRLSAAGPGASLSPGFLEGWNKDILLRCLLHIKNYDMFYEILVWTIIDHSL